MRPPPGYTYGWSDGSDFNTTLSTLESKPQCNVLLTESIDAPGNVFKKAVPPSKRKKKFQRLLDLETECPQGS